jgi:hypothetical protein
VDLIARVTQSNVEVGFEEGCKDGLSGVEELLLHLPKRSRMWHRSPVQMSCAYFNSEIILPSLKVRAP